MQKMLYVEKKQTKINRTKLDSD